MNRGKLDSNGYNSKPRFTTTGSSHLRITFDNCKLAEFATRPLRVTPVLGDSWLPFPDRPSGAVSGLFNSVDSSLFSSSVT
ncbi:hypothetical protein TcWFU_006471 [Taenia crassiceps]|uniref:Uncharacterized protein n=1 Tax=Taenia crassiceps TaxID=6207 RepID=A0ABR4QHP4_9CEST